MNAKSKKLKASAVLKRWASKTDRPTEVYAVSGFHKISSVTELPTGAVQIDTVVGRMVRHPDVVVEVS